MRSEYLSKGKSTKARRRRGVTKKARGQQAAAQPSDWVKAAPSKQGGEESRRRDLFQGRRKKTGNAAVGKT